MKKTRKQNVNSKTIEDRVGRKKMIGRKAAAQKNPIQKMASKIKAPQKLKAIEKRASQIEPNNVAKGAAAISIAAGVVAAGAMMADKENRKKAGKMAAKGMEFIQEIATTASEEARGKYQAIHMTVPLKGGNSKSRSSKKQSTKGRSR